MKTLLLISGVAGLCAGLMAGPVRAEDNHFLGHWQWDKARSTLAPGEPTPQSAKANIESADGGSIRWSAEVVDHKGHRHAETFNGKPDGTFYPVQGAGDGVTAAFNWNGGTLQSVFKHRDGGADSQTCHVEANNLTMTCTGTWSDGKGVNEKYVDIYSRI